MISWPRLFPSPYTSITRASAGAAARGEVLGVQDAEDIVLGVAIGRHSRKTLIRNFRHQLSDRSLDVDREDPIARRHYLLHAARPEVEHAMDHLTLGGLNLTLV